VRLGVLLVLAACGGTPPPAAPPPPPVARRAVASPNDEYFRETYHLPVKAGMRPG